MATSASTSFARRLRPLAAVLAGVFLAFALPELVLRFSVPSYRFRDPNSDCYWVLELEERVRKHNPGEFRDMELDPQMGWIPKASFDSGDGLTTNSRRLRGTRELDYAKGPGVQRIAVFGDSFTYGLAMADGETFCARLEAALAPIEVLNFGVNGYGTDQQYLYWSREGERYQPDIVLLAVFVPDFHRNLFRVRGAPKPRFVLDQERLRLDNVPVATPQEFVREHAPACTSASRVLDLLRWAWRERVQSTDETAFQRGAELTRAIVGSFNAEVRATGALFACVVIPYHDFRRYRDHQRIERVFEQSAAESGFPLLNLTEPFQTLEASDPSRPLYGSNGHWNAAGHAVAAERIQDFLRASGLL